MSKPKNEVLKERKKLPPSTRFQVLHEAGYKCGVPTCNHILTFEIHHILWLKDGGTDSPSNLIALCPNCHSLHTHGHIPAESIRHWKGMLLALNHAFDRDSIDLLLFLYKTRENPSKFFYSGDGVLRFSRLIASDLVTFGAQGTKYPIPFVFNQNGYNGPPVSYHEVLLSERGLALIETWMSGNSKHYNELLAGNLPVLQESQPEENCSEKK